MVTARAVTVTGVDSVSRSDSAEAQARIMIYRHGDGHGAQDVTVTHLNRRES